MNVTGDATAEETACTAPADVPWLSEVPTSGTTAAGASTPVQVTFNSTGLAAGTYTANLCVTSNDPDAGPGNGTNLVVVPVTLNVEAAPGEFACNAGRKASRRACRRPGGRCKRPSPTGRSGPPSPAPARAATTPTARGGAACASSDRFGSAEFDTSLVTPDVQPGRRQRGHAGLHSQLPELRRLSTTSTSTSAPTAAATWTNLLRWNEDHGAFRSPPGVDVCHRPVGLCRPERADAALPLLRSQHQRLGLVRPGRQRGR